VYAARVMAGRAATRWTVLLAAFATSLAGMAIMFFSSSPALRPLGVGLFVAGAVVYVIARIAMMKRNR